MVSGLECFDIVSNYIQHLNDGFEVTDGGDMCEIVTPYWRPDGDHIEIYALASSGETITFSDDGETFAWLFSVGMEVEGNDTRESLIEGMVQKYGLVLDRGALTLSVPIGNMGAGLHRFIAALVNISQITMTRKQRGKTTFKEEVELYLASSGQTYIPNYKIQGKTIQHRIDFYLNSTRSVLVEALTATSLNSARSSTVKVSFEWLDISSVQVNTGMQKFALLDDTDDKWERFWSDSKVSTPLETYSDRVIRWSQREQLLAPLIG